MKDLLIVGAGVTGALTASFLAKALPNLSLTVWEKSRGVGGRMSTHRQPTNPSLHVDMGAQYISRFQCLHEKESAFSSAKADAYSELLSNRVLQPLRGAIDGEKLNPDNPVEANYVAAKGLNSVVKHFLLLSKTTVAFQHHLKGISIRGSQLHCETSSGSDALFDGVLLTMPVPQILGLQGSLMESVDPTIRARLEAVTYSSRYALGLVFSEHTDTLPRCEWSVKYVSHPVIRFVSWDSSKRTTEDGVGNGQTLLVHTSVLFAKEHLEIDNDRVRELIQTALKEVLPNLPSPQHCHLIRWRYSQVRTPYEGRPGFVVLSQRPLVVATGDGFVGSNFEHCFLAAYRTAQAVAGIRGK